MKRPNLAFVIGSLALLLTAVASSQVSGAKLLKADIPFDFTLGDTTFPSGHYEVSVAWQGVIWVKGSGDHVKAINSQTVNSGEYAEHTKLVFRRFGDHYFLAQVWMQGANAGREIPPAREELEIMSRNRPETVDVMARK